MSRVTAIRPGIENSLAELLDIFGRTADAMVAVDGDFTIIAWNQAATDLLGYQPEEAIGKTCHEILAWRDRCGDGICDGFCPAANPEDPEQLIETQQVLGRSAEGKTLWLSASTIVPPFELSHDCRLIHMIREVDLPPELERVIVERIGGPQVVAGNGDARLDRLTARERQVLHLLAEGLDGTAIAERLFLSPATVRNHIQHILSKLGVHSRVEAVALALRRE